MQYMRKALELAKLAEGRTSPNPLVGAVVVKDGQIIGRGYHHQAGGPHAEVFALEEAGEEACGAELYVTLEPCSHYGRTPPCTKKIIESQIKKVHIAMVDPNPLVAGKGIEQLKEAGIEVEVGILEEEARRLNEVFLKYIVTKRPFVILKSAMTLDGKIATKAGESRWITNEASRAYVHELRDKVDGIMVGIGTVLADDPELTTRLGYREGKNPLRIIVDTKARIPLSAAVCEVNDSKRTLLVVGESADPNKIAKLKKLGVEICAAKEKNGQIDLPALLDTLGEREITSILLEGGSTLNGMMLEERLVDKVYFFYALKIFGGWDAPSAIGGAGIGRIADAPVITDYTIQQIENDILMTGYPVWEVK